MLAKHPFFIRLFNWEYWSFGMVYSWIYPVWLLLSLRARSFFFFSAANPSIKNGGFLGESKKEIYAIMPPHLYPATLYFDFDESGDAVIAKLRAANFNYPLIGKPDMGGRGRGVKVLNSDEEVKRYLAQCKVPFHIQKFVPFEKEAGIFYYRYPDHANGRISGIVSKKFLSVTGDGASSIRQLIGHNKRALLQLKNLEQIYGAKLETILPEGHNMVLVPYGNHARGAMFLDDSHLADADLNRVIDEACRSIEGFYFGRLDIRYQSWEELKRGENFCIIEVNGAGSEPTHIYDPKHSLFFAWKEIIRHWYILWRISRINHRLGHKYLSWKEAKEMYRDDKMNSLEIEKMPF